jgi:tripartite-type tricarboxylate transporter receptor subunit TctC
MKNLIISLCLALGTLNASAQKVTEFVVPFGTGGVSDITARVIVKGMSNEKYVVANRPGAGSQIAIAYSAKNNLPMLSTASAVFASNLYALKNLSYNPDKDLEIIASVGVIPTVLICNKKTGITKISDIVDRSSSLSFGTGGFGTNDHLVTEYLFSLTKKRPILVTYAAGGNVHAVNLLGGHIDCTFTNYPTVKSIIDHQNVQVILSSHAIPGLNAPTWEQVFKKPFPIQSYLVVNVPSTMSPAQKKEITQDFALSLSKESVKEDLKRAGLFVRAGTTSADIAQAVAANLAIRDFIKTQKLNLQGN